MIVTCNGNVCTFTYNVREPSKDGEKLELYLWIGKAGQNYQIVGYEFNGQKICGF